MTTRMLVNSKGDTTCNYWKSAIILLVCRVVILHSFQEMLLGSRLCSAPMKVYILISDCLVSHTLMFVINEQLILFMA